MATAGYYASPYYGNSKGGQRWDDGTFTSVKKITMTANDTTLVSVQLNYGLVGHDSSVRGKSFGGIVHGGVKASTKKEFDLRPSEHVTKMTGYTGLYRDEWGKDLNVIKSLTFHTDQGRIFSCGPKGDDSDYFETTVDGELVGLFGSAGGLLDSIGVYMLLDAV